MSLSQRFQINLLLEHVNKITFGGIYLLRVFVNYFKSHIKKIKIDQGKGKEEKGREKRQFLPKETIINGDLFLAHFCY